MSFKKGDRIRLTSKGRQFLYVSASPNPSYKGKGGKQRFRTKGAGLIKQPPKVIDVVAAVHGYSLLTESEGVWWAFEYWEKAEGQGSLFLLEELQKESPESA